LNRWVPIHRPTDKPTDEPKEQGVEKNCNCDCPDCAGGEGRFGEARERECWDEQVKVHAIEGAGINPHSSLKRISQSHQQQNRQDSFPEK
jgi:hypothetical protein